MTAALVLRALRALAADLSLRFLFVKDSTFAEAGKSVACKFLHFVVSANGYSTHETQRGAQGPLRPARAAPNAQRVAARRAMVFSPLRAFDLLSIPDPS